MRHVTYGTLHSYRMGLAAGSFDRDLSDDDRWAVVRLLDFALYRLQDVRDMRPDDVASAVYDPFASSADVNARVRAIIEGCAA